MTPDSHREGGYSGVSNNDVYVNNRPPVSQYITDLKLCITSCFYCVFLHLDVSRNVILLCVDDYSVQYGIVQYSNRFVA